MANKRSDVSYIVRNILLSDCKEVVEIWDEVGFQIAKYGNEVMMKTDAKGIFVAQDTESGRILGACSGVNIGPDLSFVGQYAVRAEYQGLGIGKALWVKALENMGDRNASLFAANVKIFTIYRDVHHFSAVPKKRIIHMKGEFAPNIDIIDKIDGISLMAINENNIRDVIEYDKQVCDGLDRSAMLSALYKSPENINLVAVNERNQVLGYCFVLDTSSGVTGITPLYADTQQIAELLANKCCQRLSTHKTKKMLYLCWDSNPNSIAVAEKLGLSNVRDQPILFTKQVVDGNLDKIYSITSLCFYPF